MAFHLDLSPLVRQSSTSVYLQALCLDSPSKHSELLMDGPRFSFHVSGRFDESIPPSSSLELIRDGSAGETQTLGTRRNRFPPRWRSTAETARPRTGIGASKPGQIVKKILRTWSCPFFIYIFFQDVFNLRRFSLIKDVAWSNNTHKLCASDAEMEPPPYTCSSIKPSTSVPD